MIKDHIAFKACLLSCYFHTLSDDPYLRDLDGVLCEIATFRLSGDKNKGVKIIPAIQDEFAIGDDQLQQYQTVAEDLYNQTIKIINEVKHGPVLSN